MEESKELGSHAMQVDDIQTKSIIDFQKAYEVGQCQNTNMTQSMYHT